MEYAVDRFEGDTAVLEPAQGPIRTEKIDRALLPPETREGDILLCEDGHWRVDAAATAARRERLRRRFSAPGLFATSPGEFDADHAMELIEELFG